MQQVRVVTRLKYTPEEKVRIVLEGFRREVAVRDLCRREGIKPGAYYDQGVHGGRQGAAHQGYRQERRHASRSRRDELSSHA